MYSNVEPYGGSEIVGMEDARRRSMETQGQLNSARAELERLKEMQLEKELLDIKAAIAQAHGKLQARSPR